MYITYVVNMINMQTVDVIRTSYLHEVVKTIKNRPCYETAFTICKDNSVIDWKFIYERKNNDIYNNVYS